MLRPSSWERRHPAGNSVGQAASLPFPWHRPPRLSDLRESGVIEQAANAVLFLHHLSCAQPRETPLHPSRRRYSPGADAAAEDEGAVTERAACGLLPQVEALLAANRGGPCGKARLLWHAPGLRFLEPERSGTG